MTRQEAKDRAVHVWVLLRPYILAALIPFGLWAFKTYDATNVSSRRFERYTDSVAAASILREVRDSARFLDLRREVRYGNCLDETRGDIRTCSFRRSKESIQ